MTEKYKKNLLFKTKDLNRSKNDKYIPLSTAPGTHCEGKSVEPLRVVDEKVTKLKSGDRIFSGKKAKSGRNIYSDPSIFDN